MKKLYLLRHANTESKTSDDHSRRLNKKGIEECRKIADYLRKNNISIDRILHSDAVRATETVRNIICAVGNPSCIAEKKLYLATPAEILKEIRLTENNINSLMVVGHNPGIHQLSVAMVKEDPFSLIGTMAIQFPTASLVIFTLNIMNWEEIATQSAVFEGFVVV